MSIKKEDSGPLFFDPPPNVNSKIIYFRQIELPQQDE